MLLDVAPALRAETTRDQGERFPLCRPEPPVSPS